MEPIHNKPFSETWDGAPNNEADQHPQVRPASEEQFQQLLRRLEALRESLPQPAEAPAPDPGPVEPSKPLHQMSAEEFRQHSLKHWNQRGETLQSPSWKPRGPMTIADYIERGGHR